MTDQILPSNVPATLSSFIGRREAVEELRLALATRRLLTVVGPGGAGKTRLAREVAASIGRSDAASPSFSHGVWWVELAPVRLGADVAGAVATTLGVLPTPGRHLVDALADSLRDRQLLLILDNCEHLLTEAAQLADSVLRGAPGVSILCTSREALSVEGEFAWPIAALSRPSTSDRLGAAEVATFDAVQLFVERAQAANPSFSLTDANANAVVAICERLDGLPLALELAAAVVPLLGVDALAARLDDALTLLSRGKRNALPRHRTLHAVLDWSYALLTEGERALLRELAVFRGSFTLDAMAEVCGSPGLDLLPHLGRLVEHSLIEVREEAGEVRYRLLETVRQFGSAQLRDTPEEQVVRGRHARWVAHLAGEAEPALFSPARGRTVERLRHSIDEIRGALTWSLSPGGSPIVAAEIAGALGWFWLSGVSWEEGRALLARTLDAIDAEALEISERPLEQQIAIGRLFYPILGLAYFADDPDAILRFGARELIVWDNVESSPGLTDVQRLAAARGRSLALQLIGFAYAMRGEAARSVESMDAAVAIAARSGDRWLHPVLTMRRALVYLMVGDHRSAQVDYETAVPALRAIDERWFLSLALEGMAVNAFALGDAAAGVRYARESIVVLQPEPDAWFISRSLDTLAYILASRSDISATTTEASLYTAAQLLGAAESLRQRCGASVIGPDLQRQAALVASLRSRLGEEEYSRRFASGAVLTLDDVFRMMDTDPVVSAFAIETAPAPRESRRLVLQTLGTFALVRPDTATATEPLPAGKVRELLLYLLLHERATKDEIGLALWPDASAAQVRNAFHVTLHHLRRQLGPERWVVCEQGSYRLDRAPAPGLVLEADIDALLATSARLRQAVRRREDVDPASLDEASLTLTGGASDLAAGFAAGPWLDAWQDRVRTAWGDGVDALAQLLSAAGRTADAIAACELLISREPLRESAHRLLMEALVQQGEPARALAHYASLTTMLEREIGARPATETRLLADRLRR